MNQNRPPDLLAGLVSAFFVLVVCLLVYLMEADRQVSLAMN